MEARVHTFVSNRLRDYVDSTFRTGRRAGRPCTSGGHSIGTFKRSESLPRPCQIAILQRASNRVEVQPAISAVKRVVPVKNVVPQSHDIVIVLLGGGQITGLERLVELLHLGSPLLEVIG
jgi:hypothetical protein